MEERGVEEWDVEEEEWEVVEDERGEVQMAQESPPEFS